MKKNQTITTDDLKRWEEVIANRSHRVGEENFKDFSSQENPRNEYQRDFDRLVFSSAFKRLQNKTQVFPLPGTTQVHNRLTHTLEVASVGRSLGSLIGSAIAGYLKQASFSPEVVNFYRYELKDVILAACLAHDIGNPCFGHSGEAIISDYFSKIEQNPFLEDYSKDLGALSSLELSDLSHFEGNANTMRLLTTHYYGKLAGGVRLTYLTLASQLKYPWGSDALTDSAFTDLWGKKYGFFQEQAKLIEGIAKELNLLLYKKKKEKQEGEKELQIQAYYRHPFVYLVEAADDICYLIMDMEDAQKISIIDRGTATQYFWDLVRELKEFFFNDSVNLDLIQEKESSIKDEREKIVYLRSKCINFLTEAVAQVFISHQKDIGQGVAKNILNIMITDCGIKSLATIKKESAKRIYNHHTISEAMVGASRVLPELLNLFLPAILKLNSGGQHTYQQSKLFSLINPQYTGENFEKFIETPPYKRILSLLDFLTGMTDEYITELYRKLTGIDRPQHFG